MKNDLLCVIPVREDRVVRFQFNAGGDQMIYNYNPIELEATRDIVVQRFREADHPKQQIISLVFADTIRPDFVRQAVYWISEGFLTFVCGDVDPDSTILSLESLDPAVRKRLDSFRLIFAVGKDQNLYDGFMHQLLLEKGVRDSLYTFGEWDGEEGTETHLKYLGLVWTPEQSYKIISSFYLWGLSGRATSRVLVFNENNAYLGNFHLSHPCELPDRLDGHSIVFSRSKCVECDPKINHNISLRNGIPENFFFECKDGYGDFVAFDTEWISSD